MINYNFRYIRLLSNVLEWQKSQERNCVNLPNAIKNVRIKSEPQQLNSSLSLQSNNASIYQAKAAIACLKQENLSRSNFSNQRQSQFTSTTTACEKNRNNKFMLTTTNCINTNSTTVSSQFLGNYQASISKSINSSFFSNGHLNLVKNGTLSKNSHLAPLRAMSKSSSEGISRKLKVEVKDEDDMIRREIPSTQTFNPRKRGKCNYGKDSDESKVKMSCLR